MPNLFNGFCYPTLSEAVDAEISQPINASGNGDLFVFSITTLTLPNTATLSLKYNNIDPSKGNTSGTLSVVKFYPPCSTVGSTENSLGLSMSDASSLFFAVIAVWAVAWSFKTLRRAM